MLLRSQLDRSTPYFPFSNPFQTTLPTQQQHASLLENSLHHGRRPRISPAARVLPQHHLPHVRHSHRPKHKLDDQMELDGFRPQEPQHLSDS